MSTDSESVSEAQCSRAKLCANWLSSELWGCSTKKAATSPRRPFLPNLGELVRYISDDIISGKQGKEVFSRMYESRETPTDIIERLGLRQITDEAVITAACRKVVADPALAKQIEKYKQTQAARFLRRKSARGNARQGQTRSAFHDHAARSEREIAMSASLHPTLFVAAAL